MKDSIFIMMKLVFRTELPNTAFVACEMIHIYKFFFQAFIIGGDEEEAMGDSGGGHTANDHGQDWNRGPCVQDCAYGTRTTR